ncbi:MAG: MBL fold metallo-hydrolase, partial [Bacillota bacterium]
DHRIMIYYLDVGQGDTTFIQSKSCNILVDAYGNTFNFLRQIGIYQLDYLILTHSDDDHTREANKIIESIKVKEILISIYDDAHQAYPIKPRQIKANDQIICGDLKLDFLSPLENYGSPNANSLVFQLHVREHTLLFTGDIEEKTEERLVSEYKKKLKSDVIKVPHHGSNTSSSNEFLSYVNPRYAVISLAMHNRFNFPSEEIIHRYTMIGSQIYRTDTHGTIVYTITKKNTKWSFYLPF